MHSPDEEASSPKELVPLLIAEKSFKDIPSGDAAPKFTDDASEKANGFIASIIYDEIRDRRYHIIILRSSLTEPWRNAYILEIARALTHLGHCVTYCIVNSAEDVRTLATTEPIKVCYFNTWIPKSICGAFRSLMDFHRMAWSALKLVITPPEPRPKIIFCDTHPVVLPILRILGGYSTILLPTTVLHDSFRSLQPFEPTWLQRKMVRWANEIYVENQCFLDIFDKCYDVCKTVRVLCPSVDIDLELVRTKPMNETIPDLPDEAVVFVSFGLFERRTNFQLGLDAFEMLYKKLEREKSPYLKRVCFVVAGECRGARHFKHFEQLTNETKIKDYASQVSFFKNTSAQSRKSLLKHCLAVVHTKPYDIFSSIILETMCMGCPLIAPNSGFARQAMVHRVSGFLLEPEPSLYAIAMTKLLKSEVLARSMGLLAKDTYCSEYSFHFFQKNIEMLILQQIIDHKAVKK